MSSPNSARGGRLRGLITAAVLPSSVVAWACLAPVGGAGGTGADEPTMAEVLESVAAEVLAPAVDEFALAAAGLEQATFAWQSALDSAGDAEAARDSARAAWVVAMDAWQVLEVMQVGPAGASGLAIGGEDLRDEIYSWPTVNACRVDQELVLGEFDTSGFVESRLVNVYGLDALEYLLFWDSALNSCAPQLPINAEGEWDALGPDEVRARRAGYAAAIAGALREHADSLRSYWEPGGTFREGLADPGEGSPYATHREGMNELLRAMFYVDSVLKDAKLARPAGILDCGASACPEALESQHAANSREQVVANLRGFRMLFAGGLDESSGFGFDDALSSVGAADVGADVLARTDAAIATIEAIGGGEGSLHAALSSDPDALDGAHAAVKEITDLLKGDVAVALFLDIPDEAAGDAD